MNRLCESREGVRETRIFKGGSSCIHKDMFARFIGKRGRQILARATGIKKENWGNEAEIIKIQF